MLSPRCGCMINADPSASPTAQTKIRTTRITGPQNDSTFPRLRPKGREISRNRCQIPRDTVFENTDVPARAYRTVKKISTRAAIITTAPTICSSKAIVFRRGGRARTARPFHGLLDLTLLRFEHDLLAMVLLVAEYL